MVVTMAITNRIIDIHNHSFPNVDDGAKSFEEAVENIKYLKSIGVTDIVLTSHYIINSKYQSSINSRLPILKKLQDLDLGVNLYLGNEVFISEATTLINLVKSGATSTINNSRYLLIEFPRSQVIQHLDKIICELNEAGITPIIAHPERYSYYWENFDKLKELLEYDCLFQCNIESIAGKYGSNAKKALKKMLKEGMVSILATDFHHKETNKYLEKSLKKVTKLIGTERLATLLVERPLKIISNKTI